MGGAGEDGPGKGQAGRAHQRGAVGTLAVAQARPSAGDGEGAVKKRGGLLREGDEVKFRFIHAEKASLSVAFLCRQLGVSRSGYYAWAKRPESQRKKSDRALTQQVAAIHQESRGTYGSPRVHAELRARGHHVAEKRVARLMRQQGLAARRRRPFVRTTDSKHSHPVAPNVVARDFQPPEPNRTWAGDITYIWTAEGWLYLAVVLDLFSRRVVGWSMAERIDRHLVLSALDMALAGRQAPALYHSDRGSQGGFNGSSQHSKLRSCDGCEESSTGCPSWTPSHVIARPSIRRAA
ncbi:IS3 family transposase [Corallococcus sp. CA047B]|nr:IS3 family transposase [Corallococcus sp. CA047B]